MVKFLDTKPALASAMFQVRRDSAGGVDTHWGVFTEVSLDSGQNWEAFPSSTVRETFSSDDNGEIHAISFSVPTIPQIEGMQVRFKQYADNTDVSIVSQPSNSDGAGEPTSAGAFFIIYTVK